MTTNTKPARYDGVLISLHWIIAAAVIANVAIGLIMGDIPRGTALRITAYVTHMSIGMSILILSVVLVIWRLTHKTPSLPDTMQPQLKLLARATQFILYAAILILPLLGWAMVSANGKSGPPYFGLFTWPALPFFSGMTKEGQHA
ncbi:MAG TPA: cytochrome b/b6 domain-containing protein, partial [Rhizomicrobium sp.]|nr:cytochrome b/b6 domain-containing protein [Rhizomicrobium sp.]